MEGATLGFIKKNLKDFAAYKQHEAWRAQYAACALYAV
jgi:hypothetical protein